MDLELLERDLERGKEGRCGIYADGSGHKGPGGFEGRRVWVGVGGCEWMWVDVSGCGWVWVGVGGMCTFKFICVQKCAHMCVSVWVWVRVFVWMDLVVGLSLGFGASSGVGACRWVRGSVWVSEGWCECLRVWVWGGCECVCVDVDVGGGLCLYI